MLLRKDQFRDNQRTAPAAKGNIKKGAKGKGKGQKAGDSKSHLTTDNALHHVCKLKYPSLGGSFPDDDDDVGKPLQLTTRKQSIGNKR